MTITEKQVLFEKGWSTLKAVMRSLFLQKEFTILQNGYQAKKKKDINEDLIKVLVRCKK